MIYLFYGEDELAIAETVAKLRQRLAEDDPVAELNTSDLDGRKLSVAGLQSNADAAPFMGDRRLVIVRGLVGRCNPSGGDRSPTVRKELAGALATYLPRMPGTTRLILWEDKLDKRNAVLRSLSTWRDAQPDPEHAAMIREFSPPPPARLPAWLQQRAKEQGGTIAPDAASALAEALIRDGNANSRLAATELEKLITYAGERTVKVADVEALVTPVGIESVFKLVDALAARDGPRAASLLHRFLNDGEHPLRLLALIARQFRLLTLARAHLDEGRTPGQLSGLLPVPPFVARSLGTQAGRFPLPFLVSALERLLEIDEGIKTGRVEPVLGLDLFVAGICGTAARKRSGSIRAT